jgi:hypothetical protein
LATAQIFSGICGFTTTVEAVMDGRHCVLLSIESECEAVQQLAAELTQVDPFREITFKGDGPLILRLAAQHLCHTACPVPAGIIKAVEVAAGLALPADVTIEISEDEYATSSN